MIKAVSGKRFDVRGRSINPLWHALASVMGVPGVTKRDVVSTGRIGEWEHRSSTAWEGNFVGAVVRQTSPKQAKCRGSNYRITTSQKAIFAKFPQFFPETWVNCPVVELGLSEAKS